MDNAFWKKYKYKEYLFLITVPIIFGVIFTFVIRHLVEEMSVKNDCVKKEIINHEKREKKLEEISELKKQYETIEKEKGKLEVFASQDKIINLIKQLEKTAAETGNEAIIEDVEIKDENSKKEPKNKSNAKNTNKNKETFNLPSNNYIKIKINLRGSYSDAVGFIRKIENMNYCSDIISFQMLVEKNKLVGQFSKSHSNSKKSDFLTEKNPVIGSNENNIAIKESTGEAIINSVLEIVFYL